MSFSQYWVISTDFNYFLPIFNQLTLPQEANKFKKIGNKFVSFLKIAQTLAGTRSYRFSILSHCGHFSVDKKEICHLTPKKIV